MTTCKNCKFYPMIRNKVVHADTKYPCHSCKYNPYLIDNYEEDIKPCPFCGSEGIINSLEDDYGNIVYSVDCSNNDCQCNLISFPTKEEAIKIWNKRK